METLIYILKSASILSLFYLVYFVVLSKDTFFSTNRHYLIGGIISSLLLPFLIFTKTVYVDVAESNPITMINNVGFLEISEATNSMVIDWWEIGIIIYLTGVLFMSFRFIKQLLSLYFLLRKHPSYKLNGFNYIKVDNDTTPFSFFKYIVYNPELHSADDLQMILKHEQTHASQLHSLDIIISNLMLIIQWANPIAWLYKKSIEENLEFIADSETIEQVQSIKEYQLTLIKVLSSSINQHVLTNNFYQSLIKKRIIMLHKNASKTQSQWKLLLILPLLGVFLWSFNVEEELKYIDYSSDESSFNNLTETTSIKEEILIPVDSEKTASEKQFNNSYNNGYVGFSEKINKNIADNKITVTIDKNTSEAELNKIKKLFKDHYNVTLKFSGVKRNSDGEIITIQVDMKSEKSSANFNEENEDGIRVIKITYDDENESISLGTYNDHDLHFVSKEGHGFMYEIKEDENGNIRKWVSKNGDNVHLYSGSGKNSSVWVTKDETIDLIGSNHMIFESKGDKHGNIIHLNSDSDEDNLYIHKSDDKGFFFLNNDGKDLLVFIDGKKSSIEKLKKLDSDAIDNIEIIKGEKATKEYGKKAKDGVLLITTKKN